VTINTIHREGVSYFGVQRRDRKRFIALIFNLYINLPAPSWAPTFYVEAGEWGGT
jgi:hypothetical protein